MFSDRIATFRSDDAVEREANLVRRWGHLDNKSKFNVVDLTRGPLRQKLDFEFDVKFEDHRLERSPAFVAFARGRAQATLYVRPAIWNMADAGQDESRFILAHEVGHLKMHRHDALGFSDVSKSALADMPEEDRAEPQADKFADRLLVPESMLIGFQCADDIAFMFDVPLSCAQRRLDLVQDKERRRTKLQIGDPAAGAEILH